MGFRTDSIQKGVYVDKTFKSVTTPIYPSSTYAFTALGEYPQFDYSRSGNPTRYALEQNLAALEGGIGAVINATGLAAITTCMWLFRPGDHIIAGHDIYGGTYRQFTKAWAAFGVKFSFVEMTDPAKVAAAVTPETKAIWIETPSNPLLRVFDIAALVKIAKKHKLITIADNTFLSPYFQRPLELGVDVVVQSTTKYINGHSDVVGGAVIWKNAKEGDVIKEYTNTLGTPCSPFDAFLVLRGVKTLAYRMEAHQANAFEVAKWLAKHPRVTKVYYPGLKTDPGHKIAKKQQTGFGGMLSFELDTKKLAPKKFASRLEVFHLAESLGGVESLLCQPWSMTHLSMPEDARRRAGITEALFRVSVGLEDPKDLIKDLENALK